MPAINSQPSPPETMFGPSPMPTAMTPMPMPMPAPFPNVGMSATDTPNMGPNVMLEPSITTTSRGDETGTSSGVYSDMF
jgi:hypothetical protein